MSKRWSEDQRKLAADYRQLAIKLANRYCADRNQADDVAMDALIRSVSSFDPNRGVSFVTYLRVAILRRYVRAADFQRRFSQVSLDRDSPLIARDQSHPLEDMDEAGRLLAQMTARQREMAWVRFGFDGGGFRTYDEVAELLGVTKKAVCNTLNLGLLRLREKKGLENAQTV